jgi:hypothetical protein
VVNAVTVRQDERIGNVDHRRRFKPHPVIIDGFDAPLFVKINEESVPFGSQPVSKF